MKAIKCDLCTTVYYTNRGAKQGGVGGSQPPLNFGEGGSTPPDFERKKINSSHIGPFLIV